VVVIVLTFAPAGLKPVTQTYIVTQATGTITISLSNSNVYWAVWLDDGTTATFVDCTIYSLQLSVCLPHMSIKFLGWKRFHSNIQIKKSEGYYRKTGSWLFLGWYKSSILHPRLEARRLRCNYLTLPVHGYNGACHFLQHWEFSGSHDSTKWHCMKVEYTPFSKAYDVKSFPIPDGKDHFQYFRVLQKGKCMSLYWRYGTLWSIMWVDYTLKLNSWRK